MRIVVRDFAPPFTPTKGLFAQKLKAESELSHEISDIRPAPRGNRLLLDFQAIDSKAAVSMLTLASRCAIARRIVFCPLNGVDKVGLFNIGGVDTQAPCLCLYVRHFHRFGHNVCTKHIFYLLLFLMAIVNSHYIDTIKTIFCSKIKWKICFQSKNIVLLIISAKVP
jgi:hypothetical protein